MVEMSVMNKGKLLAIVLLAGAVLVDTSCWAENKRPYISLEKAEASGLLRARITGLGGYSGECIEASLQNLKADTLFLLVEAGHQLPPGDTAIQDILLVRQDSLQILPLDSIKVSFYGFCCMAHKHSPYKDARYGTGALASDFRLVRLAEYLGKHQHEPGAMQHAIWAVSNGHSIASITEQNTSKQQELREVVARLMKTVAPWYSVSFKKDSSLCSGIPETLWADIDYQVINAGFIDMILFNESGQPVKVFFRYTPHDPDRYKYQVSLDVSTYARGTYYLRMYQDGAMKSERVIQL